MAEAKRTRVLVVDDSALVRTMLTRGLAADPAIEVIGAASDPYRARDILVRERPDVMTLDIEMPRMDGITFLKLVMAKLPIPTIIVSSLSTRGSKLALEALEEGAVDVVAKPHMDVANGLERMMADLVARVKVAAHSKVVQRQPRVAPEEARPADALAHTTDTVIGIAASTGGVAALGRILPAFPASSPGVVIVQHMPAGFTADFARRLDATCQMRVSEAKHGERVLVGHILVAPGGERHLEVRRAGGEYRVALVEGPPVSGHVPSVDVFFESLARSVGANSVGCILTGMGADGAAGLLSMRLRGARTFAQDRETCAVWGMPAAAVEIGAAEACVPLADIPARLVAAARERAHLSKQDTRPPATRAPGA
jgi:two-component system chemotaxis response regulator CheB